MATRELTHGDGNDLDRFNSCSLDKVSTKPGNETIPKSLTVTFHLMHT